MGAGTEPVLIVLVVLIAVAMVVQAISLLILVLIVRRFCGRVDFFLQQFSRDVQPVLLSARDLLTESKEKFHDISNNLRDITSMAKDQVIRLDGLLSDASQAARLQLIRMDELLSDTISRMEDASEAVRRTILAPVNQVSSVLAGLRVALGFLFRRSRAGVEHATQDEELFI